MIPSVRQAQTTEDLVNLGMLGLIGGIAYAGYKIFRDIAGVALPGDLGSGGSFDSGTQTEALQVVDIGGNPLTGSAANDNTIFTGVSAPSIGPTPLGGTLIVNDLDWLGWFIKVRIANFGSAPFWVHMQIGVYEQYRFWPDTYRLRYDPDPSFPQNNYFAENGLNTLVEPSGQLPVQLDPGDVFDVQAGWIVDGPQASANADEFWRDTGTNIWRIEGLVFEGLTQQDRGGEIISQISIRNALTTVYQ